MDDLPAAVSRYLEARRLRAAIAVQPAAELKAVDWSGFELHEALASDEAVGVGIARWGIAETGSLVEDCVVAARSTSEKPPRNVNIITGASGTTDIEGSLVLGAHGPRYLHVILAVG